MDHPFLYLICFLAISGIGIASWDFARRMQPSDYGSRLPEVAVVFSGGEDRILAGIELLDGGDVEKVFISGTDGGYGVGRSAFGSVYRNDNRLAEALQSGAVQIGRNARNTLQNALETRCWINMDAEIDSLILITSRSHMPRASIATERAMPEHQIIRLISKDALDDVSTVKKLPQEFVKFIATYLITLLPMRTWQIFSKDHPISCN